MSKSTVIPVQTHYYQFDQQGVAFNMWYLAYAEEARNGFLEANGYSLGDLLESGHDIQLVHVEVDWNAALRFGDLLTIDVSSGHKGTTSFSLKHRVQVNGQQSAVCTAVYVIINATTQMKAELPSGLRTALDCGTLDSNNDSQEHRDCIGG